MSVEKSEYLSQQLKKRGIRHEVLNAKQHEREATIVADAGRKGAVTVATNMAGRGTDIMLGGNSEFRAVAELKRRGLDPHETPEDYEAAWDEALAQAEAEVATEHEEVTDLGGLYVLGTERHESRRIDNQLRGRSGRQGDPGESRFYLSLNDDLMRLFNSGLVDRFMTTAGMEDDVPIESKMVTNSIQKAQGSVEAQNYEIRKNVLKYDDVMNRQRQVIYEERRAVLEGEDLHEQLRMFVNDVVGSYVDAATAEGFAADWDLERLWEALRQVYPVGITVEQVEDLAGGRQAISAGDAARAAHVRRAPRLRPARGVARLRHDARGGAPGRALGARPQVARAPLRDGLPPGGHRPAGDGPARPAHRVPARGLPALRGHDGGDQGGVGQPPLLRRGAGRAAGGPGRGGLAHVGRRPRRRPRQCSARRPHGGRVRHRLEAARVRRPTGADESGRALARSGVQVSGVDLQEGQRASALRYSAPGEDGHVVETEPQRTVERQADRRGKKVKRKRR